MHEQRRLLLGVAGGIAVYKACEVVSLARKDGFEVRVVLTEHATKFVTPLTFVALTGNPVFTDTFAGAATPGSTGAVDHIAWTKWPTHVLVAPLTANTLGKLACGFADNALTTVLMAVPSTTPIVLAPAMNTEMWGARPVPHRRTSKQAPGMWRRRSWRLSRAAGPPRRTAKSLTQHGSFFLERLRNTKRLICSPSTSGTTVRCVASTR